MVLVKGRKYILKAYGELDIVIGSSEDTFIFLGLKSYSPVYDTDVFIRHSLITELFYSIDKKKLDKHDLLK